MTRFKLMCSYICFFYIFFYLYWNCHYSMSTTFTSRSIDHCHLYLIILCLIIGHLNNWTLLYPYACVDWLKCMYVRMYIYIGKHACILVAELLPCMLFGWNRTFFKTIKQNEGKQNVLDLPKVQSPMIGDASIHTSIHHPPPSPTCYIYSILGRSIADIYDPRRHIYREAPR